MVGEGLATLNTSTASGVTLESLAEIARKYTRRHEPEKYLFHPDVLAKASQDFPLGIDVISSPHMPKHPRKKVWQFPRDPFVEYEASDEEWARPCGFGTEVEVDDTEKFVCYAIRPDAYQVKIPPDAFEKPIRWRFGDLMYAALF